MPPERVLRHTTKVKSENAKSVALNCFQVCRAADYQDGPNSFGKSIALVGG